MYGDPLGHFFGDDRPSLQSKADEASHTIAFSSSVRRISATLQYSARTAKYPELRCHSRRSSRSVLECFLLCFFLFLLFLFLRRRRVMKRESTPNSVLFPPRGNHFPQIRNFRNGANPRFAAKFVFTCDLFSTFPLVWRCPPYTDGARCRNDSWRRAGCSLPSPVGCRLRWAT